MSYFSGGRIGELSSFFAYWTFIHFLVLHTWMVHRMGMGVAGVGTHTALCGHNSSFICLPSLARSYIWMSYPGNYFQPIRLLSYKIFAARWWGAALSVSQNNWRQSRPQLTWTRLVVCHVSKVQVCSNTMCTKKILGAVLSSRVISPPPVLVPVFLSGFQDRPNRLQIFCRGCTAHSNPW